MPTRTSVHDDQTHVELAFDDVAPFVFTKYLPQLVYPVELGGLANVPIPTGSPAGAGFPHAPAMPAGGSLVWFCTGTTHEDWLVQQPDADYASDHAPYYSHQWRTDDGWAKVHPSNATGAVSLQQMVPNIWHAWWTQILGVRYDEVNPDVVESERWLVTRVFMHVPMSSVLPTVDVERVTETLAPLNIRVQVLPLT